MHSHSWDPDILPCTSAWEQKHRPPLEEETPLSFLSLRSSLEEMQARNRIDTLMLCLHFFNAIFNLKVT